MSVAVEPQELNFTRPFAVEEIAQNLVIRNLDDHPVAFKVKTTAPKHYCVRPNSGRIEPGYEVNVTVLLQAMKQEPPADVKCRDKFLVQSVAITPDRQFDNASSFLDSAEKLEINERKIRVNWLPAEGSVAAEVADTTPHRNRLSTSTNVENDAETSRYFASSGNESSSFHNSAPPPYSLSTIQKEAIARPLDSVSPAGPASLPAAASLSPSHEELKDRLAAAEAKLREQTDRESSGLRHRGDRSTSTATLDTKPKTTPELLLDSTNPAGVPVRIVAMLCLLSFLMAYFFF